jgi:hypothetical protein
VRFLSGSELQRGKHGKLAAAFVRRVPPFFFVNFKLSPYIDIVTTVHTRTPSVLSADTF